MQQRWMQVAVLLVGGLLVGCVESTWEATRRLDTVAGYNQFIRDHPDSGYVGDARERMAFLRVKTYNTVETFEDFRKRYPKSRYMPELLQLVEPLFFDQARRQNTVYAYRDFLRMYPEGALAAKAVGNLAYIERVLRDPRKEALEAFVEEHPESDFWAEAKQTLGILEARVGTKIQRLGVRVDVAPNVTQADRVAKGFASMIARAYRERGIQAVPLRVDEPASPDLDGWVRVDYREAPAASSLGAASLFAYCRVRLFHRDFEQPIWDRAFEAPAEHIEKGAYGRDKTIFGNSRYRFWESFFVPVATWAVSDTRVKRLNYLEEVRAIHVLGDSAALLLERGGVDFLDVSSPSEVQVAGRYRREIDLADWRGVRMLRPDLAITFGNDGAELIRRAEQGAERLARWDAGELGAVHSATLFDESTLLIGSSQGVFAVRMNRAPLRPQRLLDGDVVGLEVRGPLVYVIRPDRLEVGLPKHLLQHITARRLPLGEGFRAERVRMFGDQLLVFGRQAVAQFSLEAPTRPALVRTIAHQDVGRVADMAADGSHRFILGERGLQVVDLDTQKARDFIQVGADDQLTLKGRFALLVGQTSVEVLDLAPYSSPLRTDGVDTPIESATFPASLDQAEADEMNQPKFDQMDQTEAKTPTAPEVMDESPALEP